MMIVHEFGHVLGAWFTNGTVTKVVLSPLAISRTDVSPNPKPHIVVWAGPVLGVLIPLAIWGLFSVFKMKFAYLIRFFAGFCLGANGCYLGFGSFDGIGDAGIILQNGIPVWVLWAFALLTVPTGFLLWHRLGSDFGFGDALGMVDSKIAYLSLTLFVFIMLITLILNPE